ncbi:MAG: DNA-3-methyladenine glycosylase [Anaerolineales bacterium]|nr:MAG: DNA-3-methyladenine glycosylase [Anaerolineales bacterium]
MVNLPYSENIPDRLTRDFYARETVHVACDLIGKKLVRHFDNAVLIGRIVETEAYRGSDDAASHAFNGRTKRNAPMFGAPGHTYIYFIYGMHWLFNISAHIEGVPGGILIRALAPERNIAKMQTLRRQVSLDRLTNGPARLAQALKLDGALDDIDLVTHMDLYITDGALAAGETIANGPRMRVPGDDLAQNRPWRFWIRDNPYISS